jgi:hypothetical protein
VHDEVVAARDQVADAGQPVYRRHHVVLLGETRACRVESLQ